MRNWNVVATVTEGKFGEALRFLERFAAVGKTAYYNVLMLRADDIFGLMEALLGELAADPDGQFFLTRVIPVSHTFSFDGRQEFEKQAAEIALAWVPKLSGRSFHVRMHRRGFKGRISSVAEEQFLDRILLEALSGEGLSGRVVFDDPDAIVAVETVGTQAGMSLWFREQLRRYPFLVFE
jgi:tRNA(Ser,Leu) C12 N-acetylase TAN1